MSGTNPRCNICGNNEFLEFRGRPLEECSKCKSRARHRTAWHVYERHLFDNEFAQQRVLHLAPEAAIHNDLKSRLGAAYLTADPFPEKYPHAQCLKIFFPQDYEIFPNGYFTTILHNHVLEHIPGSFENHLLSFKRLLRVGGKMIFSIPGPYEDRKTIEGGEKLATDQERLEQFLQEDHFKLFGNDFVEKLASIEGCSLLKDEITDEIRQSICVRPGKAKIYIWQRDS